MSDTENKLDASWGALAGYSPEEALKLVTNMHGEISEENSRLKDEVASMKTPEVKEPARNLDFTAIQGADTEKAQKELEEYIDATADQKILAQRTADFERDFPQLRERAKRDAIQTLQAQGIDPSDHIETIDAAMKKGSDKEGQVNPNLWVQAYILARGQEVITKKPGDQPAVTSGVHVERPTRTPFELQNFGSDNPEYEMPEEAHAHKMFEKETGGAIPKEEWVAYRDDIRSVEDYEKYLRSRKEKSNA